MVDKKLLNFEDVVANPKLLTLASQQLMKCVAENPTDTNAIWQLAETYRKQGELEKAAELYATLCDLKGEYRLFKDLLAITDGRPQDFIGQEKCYPVPFVLKSNYLALEEMSKLSSYILTEAWENATLSKIGNGEYDDTLRRSFDLPLPAWLKQKMHADIVNSLPDLTETLNVGCDKFDRIDLYLRSYGDGQFFGIHTDKTMKIPRHLSMAYFFYIEPQNFTGGDLLLFDTDLSQSQQDRQFSESFTRVKAVQNTLAIFPSAAYHAVTTVQTRTENVMHNRYAINAHVWEGELA
ncbi:2OG-Fe(II) oxygenase [Terasakiella pusilla]|uniref:2OG-Fe(II) oxygenase n=1 Tax=Terasakiella pusilla TaxID=64973 RepID=UPI003AA82800